MMFRNILFLILHLLPAGLSPAWQQEAVPLSLEDAVALARASHPTLQMARGRVEAAEHRVTETRSALLPQLRLTGRAAFLSDVPEFTVPFLGADPLFPSINRSASARISLQQNLFSGFRLQRTLELTERNAEATRLEARRDESDLTLNVIVAYWTLYRAYRAERVLWETVEQISAHVNDVKNFRGQGLATDYDVLKIETSLSDVRVRFMEAQANKRLAQMSLNSLTGSPIDTWVFPSTDPRSIEPPAVLRRDMESLMRMAREQRPEVLAAAERRAMQEATLAAARGGWYPQIFLSAAYDYARPNPRVIPPTDAWEQTWDVGLTFQWNIWDWFATKAQSSQAGANLSVADAVLRQVHDAVALETAQAYFRASEAKDRIEVATLGTRQAEENFRITQEKFKQGLASNSDLLDAELALLQARLQETQAVADFAIQIERLRRATGEVP